MKKLTQKERTRLAEVAFRAWAGHGYGRGRGTWESARLYGDWYLVVDAVLKAAQDAGPSRTVEGA